MFNEKTLALWGKATPGFKTEIFFHPLLAHMLDVAAVAWGLPHLALTGIPRSTLAFFVALHDIGKVSRSFQALAPAAWPTALLGSLQSTAWLHRRAMMCSDCIGWSVNWLISWKTFCPEAAGGAAAPHEANCGGLWQAIMGGRLSPFPRRPAQPFSAKTAGWPGAIS